MEFNCEGQNSRNNGGTMMYNYGLDHKDLGGQFLVLTPPDRSDVLNKQKYYQGC